MNKQELIKLRKLSGFVGDFIRYWGFRRIHGQIWAVAYLSKTPLSGTELMQILQVSKALVSPAIKELVEEGLIVQVESENEKTKRYQAEEDVEKIIRGVLSRREKPMMSKISASFDELRSLGKDGSELNPERMVKLAAMIQRAHWGLKLLFESDKILD